MFKYFLTIFSLGAPEDTGTFGRSEWPYKNEMKSLQGDLDISPNEFDTKASLLLAFNISGKSNS